MDREAWRAAVHGVAQGFREYPGDFFSPLLDLSETPAVPPSWGS